MDFVSLFLIAVLSFNVLVIFYLREELGIATLMFLSLDFSFLHNLIFSESDYLRDRLLFFFLYAFFIVTILFKNRGREKFGMVKTPVKLPMVAFLASIIMTCFFSLVLFSVAPGLAFMGLMDMSHYITFFLIVYSIKNEKQIKLLIKILFAMAILCAILTIISSFNPDFPIRQGQLVEKWGFGFYRIVPNGAILFLVAFLVSLSILPFLKSRLKSLLLLSVVLIILVAILLTFTRSIWLLIIFTIPGLVILLPKRKRFNYCRRLIIIGVLAVILGISINYFFLPLFNEGEIISTAQKGILSSLEAFQFTGGLQSREPSFNYRILETKIALRVIKDNLIAGVGYKYRLDTPEAAVSYLHNGYVSILMVQGLIGFIPFLWLIVAFFLRGLEIYRNLNESPYKGLVHGLIGGFWLILMGAFLGNGLQHGNTTILCLMLIMGLCEVIYKLNKASEIRTPGWRWPYEVTRRLEQFGP